MDSEIFIDEVLNLSETLKFKSTNFKHQKSVIINFWDDMSNLLSQAFEKGIKRNLWRETMTIGHGDLDENFIAKEECLYYLLVDVNSGLLKKNLLLNSINTLTKAIQKTKCSKLIIGLTLPSGLLTINSGLVSERYILNCLHTEFSKNNDSSVTSFLEVVKAGVDSHARLRNRILILMLPSVIGLGFSSDLGSLINFELENIINNKALDIKNDSAEKNLSYIYAADAANFLLSSSVSCNKNLFYNVSAPPTSLFNLLWALYKRICGEIGLRVVIEGPKARPSLRLNTLRHATEECKYRGVKEYSRLFTSESDLMYRIWCFKTGNEYDLGTELHKYGGKLSRLKELDLEVYKEVDAICKKYDIKFMLGGGNTLGLIRSGGGIPWDDDIDICFEREEFEKFHKVAPKELPSRYIYGDAMMGNNGHYAFPKIRLKNTFFTQPRTSRFEMNDGVYLDCFIYDKTSRLRILQKIHMKFIGFVLRITNFKWYGFPTLGGRGYKLWMPIMPIIRLLPWKFFHWLSDVSLKLWRYSGSNIYCDGTGLHRHYLGFPKSYILPYKEALYEGIKVSIPENTDAYLTYLYGKDYLPSPPIRKRFSGHAFARLDLGEHLFETHHTPQFREVDLRGELYERDFSDGHTE